MADVEKQFKTVSQILSDIQTRIAQLESFQGEDQDLFEGISGTPAAMEPEPHDEMVAVDEEADPGYLGDTGANGVLRVAAVDGDHGLDYAAPGNFVTLSHFNTSAIADKDWGTWDTVDTITFDTYGHVLTIEPENIEAAIDAKISAAIAAALPDGTNEGDMLVWTTAGAGSWIVLERADTDYKVLQRLADDTTGWDWVRSSTATP
jgi:hypothetical protein